MYEEDCSLAAAAACLIGKISRLTNSSTCCRLTTCKFRKICITNTWSTGVKRNTECKALSTERKHLQVPPSKYWPMQTKGLNYKT